MGFMSVSETGIMADDSTAPHDGQQPEGDRPATAGEPGQPAGGKGRRSRELPPDRYLDREESWILFNQRVLELDEDTPTPVLERVRFLAIFASNLDEFFMVRVAGLMRRMAAGLPVEGVSVQLPGQVLNRTLDLAGRLTARHAACFSEQVSPALARHDIEILRWKELTGRERADLAELFRN